MNEYNKRETYLYRHPITKEEIVVRFVNAEVHMTDATYIFTDGKREIRVPGIRAQYDISVYTQNPEPEPEVEQTLLETFKVLMFNGKYIDPGQLHRGTIISISPVLMPSDTNVQNLVESVRRNYNTFNPANTDVAIANLMLCELVEVELKIVS